MSQVVTSAGEALFAQKAQANEQLDIDTFIFAYVPGQDSQAPVDRSEGLPPTAQQVHTQTVQQVGRINNNTVVYSTVLNSLTGPFEFNWVGLYSSVNNTLVAISHVKSVNKTITELGNAGNTLNRNFAIEYSGISDITGITVAPETWQLDFSARLAGMDALTQNLAMDMNGRDWFIGDGFKVEPTANDDEFRVIAGVGYVHGMRVELENDYVFIVQSYPQNVYVDAWFESESDSIWKGKINFIVSNDEIENYIDVKGIQHYVAKLSKITSSSLVESENDKGTSQKTKELANNLLDTFTDMSLANKFAPVYTEKYPANSYAGEMMKIVPRTFQSLNINRDINKIHTYTIDKMKFIGSGNLKFFISSYGSGNDDGLSPSKAKTWSQFSSEAQEGEFTGVGSIYLYLLDDVYYSDDSMGNLSYIDGCRIYMTSANKISPSWLTNCPKLTWSFVSSGYFTANMGAETACSVINLTELDSLGVPSMYKPVGSIGDLEPGSFYFDASSSVVHVKVFNISSDIQEALLVSTDIKKFIFAGGDSRVLVENVNFFTKGTEVAPVNNNAQVFKECIFVGGGNDSFAAYGDKISIALLGCKGAWSGKDVFNYHSLKSNNPDETVILEVNCVGYNAGVYKYENYSEANTGTESNNGSTAHEGLTIVRFGCKYWNCQGTVVADIHGCRSINYDIVVGARADGATGADRNMIFSGSSSGDNAPSETVLVNCKTLGDKITQRPIECDTNTFIYNDIEMDFKLMKVESENIEGLL